MIYLCPCGGPIEYLFAIWDERSPRPIIIDVRLVCFKHNQEVKKQWDYRKDRSSIINIIITLNASTTEKAVKQIVAQFLQKTHGNLYLPKYEILREIRKVKQ